MLPHTSTGWPVQITQPRPLDRGSLVSRIDKLIEGLSVEHRCDFIIVTVSGTEFAATFHKPDGRPLLRLLTATDDPNAGREANFIFRIEAFLAAMNKARAPGWFV